MTTVVYPGSFNPMTNGHTDLVRRALKLFDRVVVAIGTSAEKDPAVHLSERVELCREVLTEFGDRVEVEGFNTLLVDYVRAKGTTFILRGLRTLADFDYEFQMAEMNRSMDDSIEYVFSAAVARKLVRVFLAGAGDRRAQRRYFQIRPSGGRGLLQHAPHQPIAQQFVALGGCRVALA